MNDGLVVASHSQILTQDLSALSQDYIKATHVLIASAGATMSQGQEHERSRGCQKGKDGGALVPALPFIGG
jgi:hypothetical protein